MNTQFLLLSFLLLAGLLSSLVQSSQCKAGVSTEFDGFPGMSPFINSISFSPNTGVATGESPFQGLNYLQDMYVSMWVRFINTTVPQSASFFECFSSLSSQRTFQVAVDYNITSLGLDLRASVSNGALSIIAPNIQSLVDLTGWNHIAVYIDSSETLSITVNEKVVVQQSLQNSLALYGLISQTSSCQVGGGDFNGSMRHLLIASNEHSSIFEYDQEYGHSVPAPLSPFIIAYYPFDNSLETRERFSTFLGTVTFSSTNEPEKVCRCIPNDNDASYNFPRLNTYTVSFDEIQGVPYPTSNGFQVQVSFTVNFQQLPTSQSNSQQEILNHRGLWSIGYLTSSQMYATIAGSTNQIIFDSTSSTTTPEPLKQMYFLNQWIQYTFTFNTTSASVTVQDFTTTAPLIVQGQLDSPIDLSQIFTQGAETGNFVFKPQGVDGVYSELTYTINGQQVFDFQLSMDNFLQVIGNTDVTRKNYQTNTLMGYYQSGDWQLNAPYPGIDFQQLTGPCNLSDPAYAFDGVACMDQQKYLSLNQQISTTSWLEGYLSSTSNMFTFETWFKFQGFASSEMASILSVYAGAGTIQSQISIQPGSSNSSFSIYCDPNAKTPRTPGFQNPVIIYDQVELNKWMHFTCISDSSQATLTAYLFDALTTNTYADLQENSYMISLPLGAPARTIIGNDLTLSSYYKGLLREMRMWSIPRLQSDIDNFRYQSIPYNSFLAQNLLLYMRFTQGLGNQLIQIDQISQLNTPYLYAATNYSLSTQNTLTIQSISPISWSIDASILSICQPDTIYVNGCCTKADFSIQIIKSTEIQGDNFYYDVLEAQIIENFSSNSIQDGLYLTKWIIYDVVNYQSTNWTKQSYLSQIQAMLDSQTELGSMEIQIPQNQLLMGAQYIFQVTVQSLVRSYNQFQVQKATIQAACPQIKISPNFGSSTPIIVSAYMAPYKLQLTLQVQEVCFPALQSNYITWSVNYPQGQEVLYSTPPDNITLMFTYFSSNLSEIQVTATLNYIISGSNQMQTVSDSQIINFITDPFTLELTGVPSLIDSSKSDIIFDSSRSVVNVNYPIQANDLQITYTLSCPSYLFYSDAAMNTACTPDPSTGYVKVSTASTAFVNYQQYNFTYTMSSLVLNYTAWQQVTVTYFQNAFYYCPIVAFSQQTLYETTDQNFIIRPIIMLDCYQQANNPSSITTHYSFSSIQWEVDGYSTSQFLNVYGTVAEVNKANLQGALQPNFKTNITMIGTLTNGTILQAKTLFMILKAPLVINITQTSGMIAFNQVMTLDATNSYDPDSMNTTLQYTWSYNTQLQGYSSQTGILKLDPIQRIIQQMNVGSTVMQQFTITAVDPLYPNQPSSESVNIQFQIHNDYHNSILPCTVAVSGNSSYQFNMLNATNLTFIGSINSNTCFQGTSFTKQNDIFLTHLPQQLVQPGQQSYVISNNVQVQTSQISSMSPGSVMSIDFIYLAQYTDTSQIQYFDYVVSSVTITRVGTPIQVLFVRITNTSQIIQVGQESTYTIDASDSFDYDYPNSVSSFIYFWTCPAGFSCDGTGPQLQITKSMREAASLNNINSQFQAGVQIYSNKKQSQTVFITFQIVQQNYTACLKVGVQNQLNFVSIMRDQEFPVQIGLDLKQSCQTMSIDKITWTSSLNTQFWIVGLDETYITILSSSDIPMTTIQLDIYSVISYTVYGSSLNSSQQLQYSFVLLDQPSEIIPVVYSNLPASQVLDIMTTTILSLDASSSYYPDDSFTQFSCNWTCPPQIILQNCSSQGCLLQIPQASIQLLNQSSESEIGEFTVQIYADDLSRNASKQVYVTFLSSGISQSLPLCFIDNFNGLTYFDVDQEMVYYPKCMPTAVNQSYPGGYNFQWTVTPFVKGLILDQYMLSIPAFQLYQSLSNLTSGLLQISLRIYSNDLRTQYTIEKQFEIPKFVETQDTALQISPLLAFSLTSHMNVQLTDGSQIIGNSYYRLRVQYIDSSQEIVAHKFYTLPYYIYLPMNAVNLYLDIIEGKRVNSSNYNIYTTYNPNLIIYETLPMNIQDFNFNILPRLQASPTTIDPTDPSQVLSSLQNVKILQKIVEGISVQNQAIYTNIMFPQVEGLINQTLRGNFSDFLLQSSIRYELIAGLLEVLASMYLEGCWTGTYYNQSQYYLDLIQNTILTPETITLLSDINGDSTSKQMYIKVFNALASSTCLNQSQVDWSTSLSNQVFLSTMIEGQFQQYVVPTNSSQSYQFYKVSSFDQLSNNLISSSDLNSSVSLYSSNLPVETSYLSIAFTPNSNISSNITLTLGQSYVASQTEATLDLYDYNLNPIEVTNQKEGFSVDIGLTLNDQFLSAIQQNDSTINQTVLCASRQDSDDYYLMQSTQFMSGNYSKMLASGNIVCTSKHLTTFGVLYSLNPIIVPGDQGGINNQAQSIFDLIPLLMYLLPALFAVVILLLAVVGLVMSQVELTKGKRFYNKLSLIENIQRHTFLRLFGSMVLQFNPFFNYFIKPNFYLSRTLRLQFLVNYYLLFSTASLIFFVSIQSSGVLVDYIFWFGFLLQICVLLLRPRVQDAFLSFFYPSSLTNWRSRTEITGGASKRQQKRRPKSAIVNNDPPQVAVGGQRRNTQEGSEDVIELDQEEGGPNSSPQKKVKFEPYVINDENDSMRIENSEKRLMINNDEDSSYKNGPISKIADETTDQMMAYDQSPEARGDEIVMFRGKKKRQTKSRDPKVLGHPSADQANTQKQGPVKRLYNMLIKEQPKQEEVELTEIGAKQSKLSDESDQTPTNVKNIKEGKQKHLSLEEESTDMKKQSQGSDSNDRNNSNEVLRSSAESNILNVDFAAGGIDYGGFAFENQSEADNKESSQAVVIDLGHKDLSGLDFEDSKEDDAPEDPQNQDQYEYYEEEADKDSWDVQKEGGEEEQFESIEEPSKNGFSQVSRHSNELKENHKVKKRRPLKKASEENIDFEDAKENKVDTPEDAFQDESTPTLENVHKNYRMLRIQATNPIKRVFGYILTSMLTICLVALHIIYLPDITEDQFSNWISCTIFGFMTMIFVIDNLLYLLVVWTMRSSNGIIDKRKCCTMFNLFVIWPLGKWKFMELEIELAKLKDFDPEYELAAHS